jgi:hypothetical protein
MAALKQLVSELVSRVASVRYGDKVLHFGGGVAMGVVFPSLFPPVIADAAGFSVAVGKEVYDRVHPDKHTSDVWDAVWTILGYGVGRLTHYLVKAQEGPWQALKALFV